jgi:hypothetical protein
MLDHTSHGINGLRILLTGADQVTTKRVGVRVDRIIFHRDGDRVFDVHEFLLARAR